MNKNTKTNHAKRAMNLAVLGSVALLTSVFSMPIYQAHADSDKCSKYSGSGSVITDFSSATLVCVSKSAALATLGMEASDPDDPKTTLCHIPPGNASAKHTISVSQSAVPAHMAHGDVMNACSGWADESYVDSLSSCTAIEGGVASAGVWLPENAISDAPSLNSYVAQIQAGNFTGHPDSSGESYREISGE